MIGLAIKYMRKKKGLSQTDMANKINVKQNTLSRYETGFTDINFETIEKIAEICGYKILFVSDNDEFEIKELIRKDI